MGTSTIIFGGSSGGYPPGCDPMIFDNRIKLSQHLRHQDVVPTHVLATQQMSNDILIYQPEGVVWIWSRPGWWDDSFISQRLKKFDPVFCHETDVWAEKFKSYSPRGYISSRCPDPIFSSGLAAVIIAAERIGSDITTCGFDGFWHDDMGVFHDWAAERLMLADIEKHYGIKVSEWD